MRKKTKGFIVLLLALACAFSGCQTEGDGGKNVDVQLWTTNALEKVQRDDTFENVAAAALTYEMAKNEVEGAQFIVTPKNGYKVKNFTVEMGELSNEQGDKIPAKDVKVYLQKYINITNKVGSCPTPHAGYTPDALLPFDKAVEYGENTVKGVNQGVYVTVETHENTPAGTYTGVCKVNVDGQKHNVPVSVNVWNFAISEENHVGSLFEVWKSQLMYGELDISDEMYDLYNDFLAEHRLSGTHAMDTSGRTIDEYVEKIKQVNADPRISSFALPYSGGNSGVDTAYIKQYLLALIRASENDAELINKATYYFGIIDEPQLQGNFPLVKLIGNQIDAMEEEVITTLENEGYFDKFTAAIADKVKDKIRKIPNVLTTAYDDMIASGEDIPLDQFTYCPLFDRFNGNNAITGESNVDLYKRLKEVNGSVWWYGCTGPCYPYPTYHIDDMLLGSRIIGTMMYDYNIDGNLFWCANYYANAGTGGYGDLMRPVDQYEDTVRGSENWPAGDGYLMYPGAPYGIKGPVGSLRLEVIRDGNEDYEYYYTLNKFTEELSAYYNTEISVDGMVDAIRSPLYSGSRYVANNEAFLSARRELAKTIERCGDASKYVLNGITYNDLTATIEFLVSSDYAVKVNGESLVGTAQGQGKKYSYTINMDKPNNAFDIEIKSATDEQHINVVAGGKTAVISKFDNAAEISKLTPNDAAVTVSYNEDAAYAISDGSVKVEIESKFDPDNPTATLTYNPCLKLNLAANGIKANILDTLSMQVYNASDTTVEMRVILNAKGVHKKIATIALKKGWNNVSVSGVYLTNWKQLASVTDMIFEFNDTVGDNHTEAMPKQILYIDNMQYNEKVS